MLEQRRPRSARPARRPCTRVSSRQSQRDATAGAPSRRSVTISTTSGARRRPGRSRAPRGRGGAPAAAGRAALRIGRDRNGSTGAPCGQTPSSSPARTSRSARTSRASMAPRIRRRGWLAPPPRTVSRAISCVDQLDEAGRRDVGQAVALLDQAGDQRRGALAGQAAPEIAERRRPVAAGQRLDRLGQRARRRRPAAAAPAANGGPSTLGGASQRRPAAAKPRARDLICASIAAQSSRRGPRSARSSVAARAGRARGSARPKRTKRCLATPSRVTGSSGSNAARAARPISVGDRIAGQRRAGRASRPRRPSGSAAR